MSDCRCNQIDVACLPYQVTMLTSIAVFHGNCDTKIYMMTNATLKLKKRSTFTFDLLEIFNVLCVSVEVWTLDRRKVVRLYEGASSRNPRSDTSEATFTNNNPRGRRDIPRMKCKRFLCIGCL